MSWPKRIPPFLFRFHLGFYLLSVHVGFDFIAGSCSSELFLLLFFHSYRSEFTTENEPKRYQKQLLYSLELHFQVYCLYILLLLYVISFSLPLLKTCNIVLNCCFVIY